MDVIVRDAEHYVVEAQDREAWSIEDQGLDDRLAELRVKHGGMGSRSCRSSLRAREHEAPTKYRAALRTGLRFVRRDTLILSIVLVVMVTNFLDSAFSGVILPVYVYEVFESALNLGLTIASGGAGAVAMPLGCSSAAS